MLGAMAAQPKVRKVAQRQQRTKLGVLEKPKEVKDINTEDKQVHYRSCTVQYSTVLTQRHTSSYNISNLVKLHRQRPGAGVHANLDVRICE